MPEVDGRVRKFPVSIVPIKPVTRRGCHFAIDERTAVDQEDIRPSIAVVVEDEAPGAHGFGHVLLRRGAILVFEVDAGLDGDIGKGNRGILLQRGAEIRHGNRSRSNRRSIE